MRRVAAILLSLAGVSALAVVGCGSNDSGDGYQVRAIFDNAVSVIPGEDVKIAGVNVGKVDSLDVTKGAKAIVILKITEPGFQDFRRDARCQIRPQGFIGEKFVDCVPTEPKRPGQSRSPELPKLDKGPGKGQRLLPLSQTSTPVDLDLINNIFRLPYAQRFTLLLNELGAGLAGRGKDLDQVIRRANPALRETDKVLAILAKQNRTLAQLTDNSERVLRPLARNRRSVAGFIENANETAQASAERRASIEAGFERLPVFLRELRPTLERLSELSDAATPTLRGLGIAAPTINRLIQQLGPFAEASRPATRTLGEASEAGSRALPAVRPVVPRLRRFTGTARPVATDLRQIVRDLRDTGGIERIMDFLFFTTAATNGFDDMGRFLRVQLVANLCAIYAIVPASNCTANFNGPTPEAPAAEAPAAGAASAKGRGSKADAVTLMLRKVLRGMSPQKAFQQSGLKSVDELYGQPSDVGTEGKRGKGRSGSGSEARASDARAKAGKTGKAAQRSKASSKAADRGSRTTKDGPSAKDAAGQAQGQAPESPAPAAQAPGAQDPATQAAGEQQSAQDGLFNYLLGSDG